MPAPPRMEVGHIFGSPNDLRAAGSARMAEDTKRISWHCCAHASVEIGLDGSWVYFVFLSPVLCVKRRRNHQRAADNNIIMY